MYVVACWNKGSREPTLFSEMCRQKYVSLNNLKSLFFKFNSRQECIVMKKRVFMTYNEILWQKLGGKKNKFFLLIRDLINLKYLTLYYVIFRLSENLS
jgi:hypothetical protein